MAKNKKKTRGKVILSRFLLIALVILAIYIFTIPVCIYFSGKKIDLARADCIIVMGARQNNGVPSKMFESRLKYGIDLYERGFSRKIIFTGGKMPGDKYTEAETGKIYALENGVKKRDVLLENKSRDTYDNLLGAKKIMDENEYESALIISDPFHLFRIRQIAKGLGINAHVVPTPYTVVKSRDVEWYYIKYEWKAYLYYLCFFWKKT